MANDNRRKSDKTGHINLIITISIFVVSLVMTYVIGTMNSRISRIEDKQDQFMTFLYECKNSISENTNKIALLWEQLKKNIKQ